jgi:hypothetical protein
MIIAMITNKWIPPSRHTSPNASGLLHLKKPKQLYPDIFSTYEPLKWVLDG